jgi:hypothetical protein
MPPLAWSDGDFISSYKLNTSTYHRMTGLEMEALSASETVSGMIVFCTQTSSVFTAGNTYSRSLDNSSWETFDIASTQDAIDDIITDMGTVHAEKDMSPTAAKFNQYVATGGTVTYTADNGVTLNTNTTVGGNATIERAGVQLSFAANSSFQVKLRVVSSTNFTRCRVGMGAELASENNITNVRKYGIEGCSSSGVNWLVFSGSATNRTTISTATPVATAAHTSYRVSNNLSDITFRVGTATSAVKTTDLPTSFRTDNKFFRAGIQNTAAENKQIYLAGLEWAGTILDAGWV